MKTLLYNKVSGEILERFDGEVILTGMAEGLESRITEISDGSETNISQIPDIMKPSKLLKAKQLPNSLREQFMNASTLEELKVVIEQVLFGDK